MKPNNPIAKKREVVGDMAKPCQLCHIAVTELPIELATQYSIRDGARDVHRKVLALWGWGLSPKGGFYPMKIPNFSKLSEYGRPGNRMLKHG